MTIKVLHLSSFDLSGGAARAAYRIHQGLRMIGVDSVMLVQFRSGNDFTVEAAEGKVSARLRSLLDSSLLKLYQPQQLFSLQWFPDTIRSRVADFNPDVINLNWICSGFLNIETLAKLNKPLIWTLQDMWAFTGGCHYSQGCDRYQLNCGKCPQLNSRHNWDLSRWVWQRKVKAWKTLNLTIVTPSLWMAKCASASSLFKEVQIEVIPFGLNTAVFKPLDSQIARELLGLPSEKQLILFGALSATGDRRKGFHLLQEALKRLNQAGWEDRIELVVFGADGLDKTVDLGFKVNYLGHLNDDLSLRVAYAAADVMIVPSIEEAFGQTATESLACGTPVVAFKNTGVTDIIDHQQNGYLADHCDTTDLARGIAWVLEDESHHRLLRSSARRKAEQEFSLKLQADRYLSLYSQILNSYKQVS